MKEVAMSGETWRIEAVRDPDMDERCDPEARWWRCPWCGRKLDNGEVTGE